MHSHRVKESYMMREQHNDINIPSFPYTCGLFSSAGDLAKPIPPSPYKVFHRVYGREPESITASNQLVSTYSQP